MTRYQVFIDPRITHLIRAKTRIRPHYPPDPDLWRQVVVDLLDNIRILDDELHGYHIAGSMDAFVRPGTAHQSRFLRIIRVSFGDRTCSNERLEKVSLDRLLLVIPTSHRIRTRYRFTATETPTAACPCTHSPNSQS